MNADESFPQSLRIRERADFDRAMRDGRVAADGCLVIHARPNARPHTRLGLSLSRRVGDAPLRNRWKRVIREAFRRNRRDLPPGLDLVVRPRKGATCAFDQVQESLRRLARQLQRHWERRP
jgi:ribonuclease P protein component